VCDARQQIPRLACWCAADLEANLFWRAAGFLPTAMRQGGRRRGRRQIKYERAIGPALFAPSEEESEIKILPPTGNYFRSGHARKRQSLRAAADGAGAVGATPLAHHGPGDSDGYTTASLFTLHFSLPPPRSAGASRLTRAQQPPRRWPTIGRKTSHKNYFEILFGI